jgi:hypothetical protein
MHMHIQGVYSQGTCQLDHPCMQGTVLATVDHINRFILPSLAAEYNAMKDTPYEQLSEEDKGKMSHIVTAMKNWAVRPMWCAPLRYLIHAHAATLPCARWRRMALPARQVVAMVLHQKTCTGFPRSRGKHLL